MQRHISSYLTGFNIRTDIEDSKQKESFSSYIIIFLLLYITSSYYLNVSNVVPGIVSVLLLLFSVIIGIFLNAKDFKLNFSLERLFLLFFLLIVALISAFIYQDGIYNHVIILAAVISGYLFTLSYSFNRFVKIYTNLMYFISIFSLVVFLIVSLYPSILYFAPIVGQRVGVNVHNLFFSVALPGAEFNRNYGFFWEPGAFEVYLNMALMFELFLTTKVRRKYIIIFIATIATTFSTTGYFALVPIIIAYILKDKNYLLKNLRIFKYIALLIIVVPLMFKLMPEDYSRLLFGKLNGVFTESGSTHFSTSVRINAVVYPFYEFIKSPFIGIGYEKYLSMAAEKLYTMPTCTPINWFTLFGVLWGIPCNYYYLKNSFRYKCGTFSKILLAIAMLIIIFSEDFIRIAFIYVLVFYGVDSVKFTNKVEN
ncbi:hypothetical protein [Paenibacillus montanisoli]|uniref:Oligosaccharide repeat unit polymerase n=1 Tax=Paenibacillus montanisoli TaxID=2081970 RepID=A0A328TY11_9BACL|nr:hypothetical protein [Paenibacillus montanisoli]RAP74011.1 hypothetical protein DL346_23330 [Paenibacillus montanisoli]